MPDFSDIPDGVDLTYAVLLPPEQAVAYLREKGVEAANDRAFTVASLPNKGLLAEVQAEVMQGIEEGISLHKAIKRLDTLLKSRGWTDKAHCVETIIETNTALAYGQGRYERQRATIRTRPYWEYVAKIDALTRESHATLDGKVWRANDPIWRTIYPPNGYSCRCMVRALNERDLERRGLTVSEKSSVTREVAIESRNPVTGHVTRRPVCVARWTDVEGNRHSFRPDPGWAHAPGETVYEP